MKSFAVLVVVILGMGICASAQSAAPISGTIQGTVIDANNAPLTGATVTVRQIASAQQTSRSVASTDSLGRFQISNLGVGTYIVTASKYSTGMENPHAFVAPETSFTVLAIVPGVPTAQIVLRLGKEIGFVSGQIKDSVSGAPVVAQIDITVVSSGVHWMSAAIPPNCTIPVPSDAGLAVQISAVGYQPWLYSNVPGQSASALLVHRKETKALQVTLQPVSVN